MVLSAAEPENTCERVRELEPANLNPHPGPLPHPTNATTGARALLRKWYELVRSEVFRKQASTFLIFYSSIRIRDVSGIPSYLGKSKRQGSFLYLLSWKCAGTRSTSTVLPNDDDDDITSSPDITMSIF